MDSDSMMYLRLKMQVAEFRQNHSWKETSWMLDCKILSACQVWIDFYNKYDIETLVEFIEGKLSPLRIFEETYHILVNRKAIVPIKDIGNSKKLQELVLKFFPVTKSVKTHEQRCKLLYVLSCLPIEVSLK